MFANAPTSANRVGGAPARDRSRWSLTNYSNPVLSPRSFDWGILKPTMRPEPRDENGRGNSLTTDKSRGTRDWQCAIHVPRRSIIARVALIVPRPRRCDLRERSSSLVRQSTLQTYLARRAQSSLSSLSSLTSLSSLSPEEWTRPRAQTGTASLNTSLNVNCLAGRLKSTGIVYTSSSPSRVL